MSTIDLGQQSSTCDKWRKSYCEEKTENNPFKLLRWCSDLWNKFHANYSDIVEFGVYTSVLHFVPSTQQITCWFYRMDDSDILTLNSICYIKMAKMNREIWIYIMTVSFLTLTVIWSKIWHSNISKTLRIRNF